MKTIYHPYLCIFLRTAHFIINTMVVGVQRKCLGKISAAYIGLGRYLIKMANIFYAIWLLTLYRLSSKMSPHTHTPQKLRT